MAIVAIATVENILKLPERRVGTAITKIVYEQMIDCVCLTGYHSSGLLGTHISPGESEEELVETFKILRMGGGKSCLTWYLAGCFTKHFVRMQAKKWNSQQKMVKLMREYLYEDHIPKPKFMFCDTSPLYSEPYGGGFTIVASHHQDGINFSYCVSGGGYGAKPESPLGFPFVRV